MHLRHIISLGLFLMSLAGSGGAWAVQCPNYQYTLTTQAEVDAFPQDCDSVLSSISISGSDITNIDSLSNITSVGASLQISNNTALPNIDGLVNLTSVGGDLSIGGGFCCSSEQDNAVLTNIDGLINLTSVAGSLTIGGYYGANSALTNLDGLGSLTSVGGSLSITSDVYDPQTDQYSAGLLANLDGLSSLTSVGGSLSVNSNSALTNLDGLSGITSVESTVSVQQNTALTNIDGLANLTSVGGQLNLYYNDALTTLGDLSSLTSVGDDLRIQSNDALTTLGDLSSLTSVGGQLRLYNNTALTTLGDLSSLTSVGGQLYLNNNTALTTLGDLSSLTSVGGQLYLYSPALTTLDGLGSLTSVGGDLYIQSNSALTNLDGLANITSVGGELVLRYNYGFTNCQGIAIVLGWPSGPPDDSVGGSITINSNGVIECNSVEAILASVSGPSQPVINTATGGNQSIAVAFSLSTTIDTSFPITGYEGACTGSIANPSETSDTPLLDNTPVQSTLTVNGYDPTSMAALIEVAIDITHSDPTDLVITLTSPAGTILTLWNGGSSGGENLVGTFSTTLTPVDSLSLVTQESMDGNWTLDVEDVDIGPIVREGVLNSWGMLITEQVVTAGPASPIIIVGLTNGRDHSCTVAPVTGLGTLPLSSPVIAMPVAGTGDCSQNDYILNTQAEVDAFPQDCDSAGSLLIQNGFDITNLNSLSNLTSVVGNVDIDGNNALINLDGLGNLASVGGRLDITVNGVLTNIDGLTNLASVGGRLRILDNTILSDLNGLSGLTSVVGRVYITRNDALANVDGLSGLTSVGGYLFIADNDSLTNCQGLAPVLGWPSGPPSDSVVGDITVELNGGVECESVESVLASVSGPTQPVINTATAGDESISLAFNLATTPDVLFSITGYEARCLGLTEIVTAAGVSSPIAVGDLTNYREYACTVAPVTRLGTLPLSSPVSATPTPELEAPSTPQITSIDYGDSEAYISASVSNNGGSAITSYTATCSDGAAEFTGTSTTSPITVSGLTNGVSYTCSVTATNAAGTSTASVTSPPVIPATPPDAPTIDSIVSVNGQAIITFTPGADNGSSITGYRTIRDDGTVTSTILGTTGSEPLGIAMDAAGNIYTANGGSNTVSKITPDGTSSILGTTGNRPKIIAIDAAGNIYTANRDSNTVSKITPDGTSSILGTTGSTPLGITIDGVDNIYTANYNSDTVSKITPEGISTIFGTTGNKPKGIAIDAAGNIYTANSGSDTVSKITPEGISTILGVTGNSPRGITVGAAGNIYTANSGSNTVSKITPDGIASILGTTGSSPRGIAMDAAGNIYTANESNNVSKITPYGTSTILGTTGSSPFGIAIDAAGNIYTANSGSDNVSKITAASVVTVPATGDTSPITITGLTNDIEYLISLIAVNDAGESVASNAVAVTPISAVTPDAPQITDIEPGNAQITISVSVADDGGSPITGYTAYCFGDSIFFGASSTSSITVSGLTNGQAYECLVTATNAVGTSPISESSAPVTPVAPPPGC